MQDTVCVSQIVTPLFDIHSNTPFLEGEGCIFLEITKIHSFTVTFTCFSSAVFCFCFDNPRNPENGQDRYVRRLFLQNHQRMHFPIFLKNPLFAKSTLSFHHPKRTLFWGYFFDLLFGFVVPFFCLTLYSMKNRTINDLFKSIISEVAVFLGALFLHPLTLFVNF